MVRKLAWGLLFLMLGISFITAAGWMFGASEPFGHCIHERKNGHAYQALHEKELFVIQLITRVRLNSVCAAHVANVYQGAITGLSGIAVAFFTGTLWWVTWSMVSIANKQRGDLIKSVQAAEAAASASSRQADAAEKAISVIERGYIYVESFETSFWPIEKESGAGSGDYAQPRGRIRLINFGRTPATVTGVLPYAIITNRLPDNPAYFGRTETYGDVVIAPGKPLEKEIPFELAETITDEDIESLANGTKVAIFVCRIRYEDVFEVEHFRGAAALYDHRRHFFLTVGGKAYNYDRKANPEDKAMHAF